MNDRSKAQLAALAGVFVLYAAMRINGLAASCLWFDEIFSIHAAEHSWRSIFGFVALDLIHPPLFYVLLKLWIALGGDGLVWLRSLPVVLSVVAVFPFAALCRELKLRSWTQVLAVFLFAVNGSLIKYAQEVRMYSLLLCLSLFSMWLFSRYFVKGKSYLPLVIVNVLLVYTHYFGWFVVVAEVTAIVIFQPIKWRRALVMMGIAGVCFLPWLITVWNASREGSGLAQNIGWMSRPGITAIFGFALNLVEPFHYQASSAEPVSIYRITIPLVLIGLAAAALFLTHFRSSSDIERRNAYLLGIFIALPVVTTLILSWWLPYSVWGTRHLIIVFAPSSILLAIFLTSHRPSWMPAAATALVVLLSGYAFVLRVQADTQQYSWCAWEPLGEAAANLSAGVPVYTVEDLVAYHLWFAGRKDQDMAQVIKLNGIAGLQEDTAYFLPRGFDSVRNAVLSDVEDKRLWLAVRGPDVSGSEPPLRDFLVKGYRIVDAREIKGGPETAAMFLLER